MKDRKRILLVFLTLIPVILLMVLIFSFSSQEAHVSDQTSDGIVMRLIALLIPGFETLSESQQESIRHICAILVRKGAHLTEYLLLGASLMLHIKAISVCRALPREALLSFLAGALYAVSDELHQLFVPGRSGEVKDVLLDSFGVLLGVLLIRLAARIRERRRCK